MPSLSKQNPSQTACNILIQVVNQKEVSIRFELYIINEQLSYRNVKVLKGILAVHLFFSDDRAQASLMINLTYKRVHLSFLKNRNRLQIIQFLTKNS